MPTVCPRSCQQDSLLHSLNKQLIVSLLWHSQAVFLHAGSRRDINYIYPCLNLLRECCLWKEFCKRFKKSWGGGGGTCVCCLTRSGLRWIFLFSFEVCVYISISQVRDHTRSVMAEIIAYTTCIQQTGKKSWDAKQVICWEIRTKEDETVTSNITRVTWVHLRLSRTYVHLSGAFLWY